MGPIKLDKTITGQMKKWGGDFESNIGCNHDTDDDKIDKMIDSKKITLNVDLDPNRAKPNSLNPGFDKSFWSKAKPLEDTTGHGRLTKALKD